MDKTRNRMVFLLSLVGIVIAIYVLQSFIRQSPIVCVNTGCETVRKSAQSYIFGVPVPAFGLVGYTALAILAFVQTVNTEQKTATKLLKWMLGVATFGVLFVSWFTYTELFIIRAVCTWCAVSTVNMLIIFALTLASYQKAKTKA
ncbi:MAG: vitamin K epoxide reductase family protein [bacterium]|nr:vitamin K epoxide reductase family protein [bacterium]